MKNKIIKTLTFGSCTYLSFTMLKESYYSSKLKKYNNRKLDIEKDLLTQSEKKEYNFLTKHFEDHMGQIIIKNVHSSEYLIEVAKTKMKNLQEKKFKMKYKLENELIEVREREALSREVRDIEEELGQLGELVGSVKGFAGKYDVFDVERVKKVIGEQEDKMRRVN